MVCEDWALQCVRTGELQCRDLCAARDGLCALEGARWVLCRDSGCRCVCSITTELLDGEGGAVLRLSAVQAGAVHGGRVTLVWVAPAHPTRWMLADAAAGSRGLADARDCTSWAGSPHSVTLSSEHVRKREGVSWGAPERRCAGGGQRPTHSARRGNATQACTQTWTRLVPQADRGTSSAPPPARNVALNPRARPLSGRRERATPLNALPQRSRPIPGEFLPEDAESTRDGGG